MAAKIPIKLGFNVVINPETEHFRFGRSASVTRYQRQQTVGTVREVGWDTACVLFTTEEGPRLCHFAFDELNAAPRTGKQHVGGMKFDGDKPRMDLLVSGCPNALEQVSTVLTFGAKKYAAHSWQTVPGGDTRYLAALLRHLTAIGKGEQTDPESGLSHLAHVACNALFILELECRKKTGACTDAV